MTKWIPAKFNKGQMKRKKERGKKKQRTKKSIQVPNILQPFTKHVETSMILKGKYVSQKNI